jgi:hypothetical protein
MNHLHGGDTTVEGKKDVGRETSGSGQKDNSGLDDSTKTRSTPLPKVTFSTFIISLNTSALVHLGEIPEPGSQTHQKDLALAQHAINTLAMLGKKTAGNLSDDEKRLLENLLYDLRLRFVTASS